MEISNVKISFLRQRQDGLLAIASFTINDKFLISGVGIHEMRDGDGYRLTYPTKKSGDRIFNICHPINRQLSKTIYAAIKGIEQGEALRELSSSVPRTMPRQSVVATKTNTKPDDAAKISHALNIWSQGQNIARTPAEKYLNSRNLTYTHDMPLKYHPSCPKGQERYPAMLALITDAETSRPCGIHRTFINQDGNGKADCKPNKMMLGRAKNAVIRLTPDENSMRGLGIAEGVENGLAILGIGWATVWVALSSGGIANFPVLPNMEALTIFADNDKAGQDAAEKCALRWAQAGREVLIHTPLKPGTDWNDAILEVTS